MPPARPDALVKVSCVIPIGAISSFSFPIGAVSCEIPIGAISCETEAMYVGSELLFFIAAGRSPSSPCGLPLLISVIKHHKIQIRRFAFGNDSTEGVQLDKPDGSVRRAKVEAELTYVLLERRTLWQFTGQHGAVSSFQAAERPSQGRADEKTFWKTRKRHCQIKSFLDTVKWKPCRCCVRVRDKL